ncbi:MAG: hypothetical protein CMF96_06550 [Candidatus Marinimicrobia bacterium]|nr:hypothetical protein [Candidatus Neomarinimicrobiota bacterium]
MSLLLRVIIFKILTYGVAMKINNYFKILRLTKIVILNLITVTLLIYSQNNIVIESTLTEESLLFFIQENYTPENIPSYDSSRDIILSNLDNQNNQISCVYSGYTIDMIGGYCNCDNGNDYCNETDFPSECDINNGNWIEELDPSVEAYYKDINIEHTWPRSMGAEYGNPKSDMHHLFPTKSNINSSRGNDPFAEIPDNDTHKWYRNKEIVYNIPIEYIDEYSEKYNPENQPELELFEPKEDHKGNAARAMFYFFAIYQDSADLDFWGIQKSTLLDWHYNDPVDIEEFERAELISEFQNNLSNPFILDSTLARRIWYYNETFNNPHISFNINQMSVEESDLEILLEIQYVNPDFSQDAIIEIIKNGTIGVNEFSLSQSQFTFSLETSSTQTLLINIGDDEVYEGSEKLILEFHINSGPNNLEIGNPGVFILNVLENDFPKVIISEVMINPQNISDSNGEWFEIYIQNEIPINFKNWIIKDNDTDEYLITENYEIQNSSYAIFTNNSNPYSNGGIYNAYEYGDINLANAGDELYLISPEGFVADSIWWDDGGQFPFGNGFSMALINNNLNNLEPINWQESNIEFSSGDFGTPGLENCFFPYQYDECGVCNGNDSSCNFTQGDVNLDGNINVIDAVVLVSFILGTNSPNLDQIYTSDLNQDLALNVIDVVQIIGIILSN